ncbi:MAG TPA: 8-amino-7-oxononanoate synthase, partial [Terriglobia bacterium]|nr:8-amino-7-oxononanoate synthase [Terriglobia bacterium]
MSLLDKFRPIADARQALAQLGEDPFHATIERIVSPTEAIVNGRPMILAGTNNYLGLTLDTECIEAAV